MFLSESLIKKAVYPILFAKILTLMQLSAHAAVDRRKRDKSPAGKERRRQVSNGIKAGVERFEGDTEEDSGCLSVLVSSSGKETYLQMLLADNFIHADMHPGNILLRISKATPPEAPTLVLIGALSLLALLVQTYKYSGYLRQPLLKRPRWSLYVSIRQHTSAYVA
jgi:hypothetical protein